MLVDQIFEALVIETKHLVNCIEIVAFFLFVIVSLLICRILLILVKALLVIVFNVYSMIRQYYIHHSIIFAHAFSSTPSLHLLLLDMHKHWLAKENPLAYLYVYLYLFEHFFCIVN